MRRWSTTGPFDRVLFHGLGTLPERDGNVCYRYAIDRGDVDDLFATADIVVEGDYTFPGVYQYAMETHIGHRPVGRRRHHDVGDLPAPLPGARRDRRPVRRAPGQGAHHRAIPRRRLRQQVVHQDGAHHGGPGAQGRPARSRSSTASPSRWSRPAATAPRSGCAPPPTARARLLARDVVISLRYRRVRRQRSTGDRDRRRCGTRAVSLGRRPGRCPVRLHQHRTIRLVPGVRRLARPVGR